MALQHVGWPVLCRSALPASRYLLSAQLDLACRSSGNIPAPTPGDGIRVAIEKHRHHPDCSDPTNWRSNQRPVEPAMEHLRSSEGLLLGHRILRTGTADAGQPLERTRRRQRRTLIGSHCSTSFWCRSPPFRSALAQTAWRPTRRHTGQTPTSKSKPADRRIPGQRAIGGVRQYCVDAISGTACRQLSIRPPRRSCGSATMADARSPCRHWSAAAPPPRPVAPSR